MTADKTSITHRVTAVIPTYRRPALLARAVRSVLNQSHPDLEVRVFDNASGDDTRKTMEALMRSDSRVKYHAQTENIGAFRNFVFGMKSVSTPFFSLLSDDDFLLPDFYRLAVEGLARFPEAMFFAGATVQMDEKGGVFAVPMAGWPREGFFRPEEGLDYMLGKTYPTWTGMVFRTEVIERIGLLDEEVGDPSDIDFEFRTAARFPYLISKAHCAVHVRHSRATYQSARVASIWPGWLKMIRHLTEDPRIVPEVRARAGGLLGKLFHRTLFLLALKCLKRGDLEEVRKAVAILEEKGSLGRSARGRARILKILLIIPPLRWALWGLLWARWKWMDWYHHGAVHGSGVLERARSENGSLGSS